MTPVRYTLTARILHWLMVLLILGAFALALSFDDMPLSPRKLQYINYHKWLGITVLWLVAVRLLWRLKHPAPELPAHMPKHEKMLAHLGHIGLYVLMFGVPIGGWLMSSAKGFPVVYLGLIPLPDLIGKNEELGKLLKEGHELFAWGLLLLAAGHAAAALKHHFIDKDDVLRRMLG
ncbi:cytochrome b [Parachitinimonas caeni]|uniref:Cytochrome b n=1 Tax=Parachitinimonas caeni TaxID=3031301 RepID=A0ABT7DT18_9NEIS|nr:cytochrome b [Parachitinimonas caeni]MDK2123210.1 cytochrome b [Parachitinimonas caeni]